MNIVLFGAPASGKGTQAKKLSQEFNLLHISTGQLIRSKIKQKDMLASQLAGYVQKGKLVPDKLVVELLKDYLEQQNKFDGILFDGFPRTENQAVELDKIVKIDYCFEIDVSLKEVLARVTNRFNCESCGKTYIMSEHNSNVCSVCNKKLVQRADDTEQTAKVRYNDYMQVKNSIIAHYKNKNVHHYINGEQSAEKVFDQICKILK